MRSAVWMSLSVVIGFLSRELARRDSRQQSARGAGFAEFGFTSHWGSTVVACAASVGAMWVSTRTHTDAVTLVHCILVWSGIWLSFVDIDTHTIPRGSQCVAWCLACLVVTVTAIVVSELSFTGAIVGSLVMWGLMKMVELLSQGDIGPADAVFAGFLGMFVGAQSIALVSVALFVAFMAGGLVALVLIVVYRFGKRSQLPFAPFLFLGAVVAVLR